MARFQHGQAPYTGKRSGDSRKGFTAPTFREAVEQLRGELIHILNGKPKRIVAEIDELPNGQWRVRV